MKIKDIVSAAATLLGREDICSYLSNGFTEDITTTKKDTDILLRCFNLVENEIALEYKPLIYCENISNDDGLIYFQNLEKQIIEIIKVEDESGNKLKYKLFNTYLKTKPENIIVYYSYIPEKKDIEGESDYSESIMPLRIMAQGIACEFTLISAMYDEAVLWDKRYKDSLERICIKTTKKTMPARRWI
jgi:hypothetical protein